MQLNHTIKLRRSVLQTLAYFGALQTPITLSQVGRYLIGSDISSLHSIINTLNALQKEGMVEKQKGLYWLKILDAKNHKNQWLSFIQKEKIAQKKLNMVRKATKIIRFIPGIRGLFICGSVARKVCLKKSDIDFFIIAKKSRVWTIRFFITLVSVLLGKKTNDSKPRNNKFCLNHFRSDEKPTLEKYLQDLYSAQEYSRMINICSDGDIENQFFEKNKNWMAKHVPNFHLAKPALVYNSHLIAINNHKIRNIIKKFGDMLEELLKYLQTAKILKSSQQFTGLDNRRIVTDNEVIMFHLNPRAPEVLSKYQRIIAKVR